MFSDKSSRLNLELHSSASLENTKRLSKYRLRSGLTRSRKPPILNSAEFKKLEQYIEKSTHPIDSSDVELFLKQWEIIGRSTVRKYLSKKLGWIIKKAMLTILKESSILVKQHIARLFLHLYLWKLEIINFGKSGFNLSRNSIKTYGKIGEKKFAAN